MHPPSLQLEHISSHIPAHCDENKKKREFFRNRKESLLKVNCWEGRVKKMLAQQQQLLAKITLSTDLISQRDQTIVHSFLTEENCVCLFILCCWKFFLSHVSYLYLNISGGMRKKGLIFEGKFQQKYVFVNKQEKCNQKIQRSVIKIPSSPLELRHGYCQVFFRGSIIQSCFILFLIFFDEIWTQFRRLVFPC